MRHCNESQTDQKKVLDDCSHMISTLISSALKVTLLQY